LRVARAVIGMAMRMGHEQRQRRAVHLGQQIRDRGRERHRARVLDGTAVDEQRAFVADE
jgi:hypothetical protein